MAAVDPKRLLQHYNEGRIVRGEMLYRLVQAASHFPPSQIAADLPPQELRELESLTGDPPGVPEQSPRIAQSGTWTGPHDGDTAMREDQRLWYEGAWQWYKYFQNVCR